MEKHGNWQAAREAKWECEEILETKGGSCRDTRKRSAMRQRQDVCKSSNITGVQQYNNERWKGTLTHYRLENYD